MKNKFVILIATLVLAMLLISLFDRKSNGSNDSSEMELVSEQAELDFGNNPSTMNNHSICISFKYKKDIDGFEVSGKFYPVDNESETGDLALYFKHVESGIEYQYYANHRTLSSLNKIKFADSFDGWKNNTEYELDYLSPEDNSSFDDYHPLGYETPFQFLDIDFDGENELLISANDKLQGGSRYETFKLKDSRLVKCNTIPIREIQSDSYINMDKRDIILTIQDGAAYYVKFSFKKGIPVKLADNLCRINEIPAQDIINACIAGQGTSDFVLDTLMYNLGEESFTYIRKGKEYRLTK